jgi:23S rRNA (guanosine2251-2'-O)-methyltransferase
MEKILRLFGRNSVLERLRRNPASILKVYLREDKQLSQVRKLCRNSGICIESLPRSRFKKISRGINSQGIIALTRGFQYFAYEELLGQCFIKKDSLLFLDNIVDPQNFGSIIRSLACLGGFAIVIPVHNSVEVTESVLRVASGGENYVSIARVKNLSSAIELARERGYYIAAAVVEAGQSLYKTALPLPMALIIGCEHKGIRQSLFRYIDLKLTLPMPQSRLSFNVAVACALFAYEIKRQKIGK